MLPWFLAYDHTNYARYLPVYLVHMLELPDKHPDAYSMLSQGDFGVQRTTSHGFSQLPVDQTIEQTLNRNTKTKGGIIGFSLKKGAVQRWMLTAHARASFVDRCREMASSHPQNERKGHKESGSVRKRRDEEDVQKIMDVISHIFSSIVLELCSNQEEADTRMFLHALHASNAAHQQILIKSSDTDVEVLACYFREYISADIFLLSGKRSRARVITVTQVCEQLGVEVCRALPGLHALTGCDTVSSFTGKGKKAALDIVKADEDSRASILRIGEHVPPIREDLKKWRSLFVHFTMTLTVVRSSIQDTSSPLMRTTPVVKEMPCKSYLMINRIVFLTYFLKSFFKSSISAD